MDALLEAIGTTLDDAPDYIEDNEVILPYYQCWLKLDGQMLSIFKRDPRTAIAVFDTNAVTVPVIAHFIRLTR